MKKKILEQEVAKVHYKAGALIVWCFDDRFSGQLSGIKKTYEYADVCVIAGGAKDLAFDDEAKKETVLFQIKASIQLHNTSEIILMMHKDCGACKGLFEGMDECEFLEQRLLSAKQTVEEFLFKEQIPLIPIRTFIADFEGVSEYEYVPESEEAFAA